MRKKILALILCLAVCIAPTGFASAEELASPQILPADATTKAEAGIEVGELILEEELELSALPEASALLMDEEENSEAVSEITEVSGLYDIKPMPDFQRTWAAAAALPDISLGAIVIRGDQPYPSNANTKVEVGLNNVGSASATNVVVSLYLDGTLKGKFMIEGTLNPGDSGTFYCTANILGGTHTLKMIANEDRTITESNYTNNTKETTRTWADCIALSVDAFRPEDGSGDGVVRETKVFEFAFANRGNITAHDVKLIFKVNGSTVNTSTMSVSPKKILSGTIPFTFLKYGKYKVEFFVEPGSSQTDITPNNDAKGYTVNMDYDVEALPGKLRDPKNLGVKIDASAKVFIKRDDTLTLPMCKTSLLAWNGINSKVSFGEIVETTSDVDGIYIVEPRKLDYPVYIRAKFDKEFTRPNPTDIVLAVTSHAVWTDDTTLNIVPSTKKEIWDFSLIELNWDVLPGEALNTQRRTFTHEAGHVLGLDHPLCNDTAMMRQTKDPLLSYSITDHDKHNLREKY